MSGIGRLWIAEEVAGEKIVPRWMTRVAESVRGHDHAQDGGIEGEGDVRYGMSAEWVETEQLAVNHRSLVDLELIVPTEIRLVVVPPGMDRIDKQIVFQDEVLLLGPTVHDAVRTNVIEEVRCGPRRRCARIKNVPIAHDTDETCMDRAAQNSDSRDNETGDRNRTTRKHGRAPGLKSSTSCETDGPGQRGDNGTIRYSCQNRTIFPK